MERAVIALVIFAVVVMLAERARRADRSGGSASVAEATTESLPKRLDPDEFFESDDAEWLVAVFTEATCLSCGDVAVKASALASSEVSVVEVEYGARTETHERYAIHNVPTVLITDRSGAVKASFLGPVSAADLWATVAELREPGSVPEGCDHGATPPPS